MKKGGKVPFFIEQISESPELQIKFDDVNSREAAIELTGKPIFIRHSDLIEPAEDNEPLDFFFLDSLLETCFSPFHLTVRRGLKPDLERFVS